MDTQFSPCTLEVGTVSGVCSVICVTQLDRKSYFKHSSISCLEIRYTKYGSHSKKYLFSIQLNPAADNIDAYITVPLPLAVLCLWDCLGI